MAQPRRCGTGAKEIYLQEEPDRPCYLGWHQEVHVDAARAHRDYGVAEIRWRGDGDAGWNEPLLVSRRPDIKGDIALGITANLHEGSCSGQAKVPRIFGIQWCVVVACRGNLVLRICLIFQRSLARFLLCLYFLRGFTRLALLLRVRALRLLLVGSALTRGVCRSQFFDLLFKVRNLRL